MQCDAIVNAANSTLLGGGGVDGAIHRAAGPALLEACKKLGGCDTGSAKITKGYALGCKYIIHTVGPVWHGGGHGEEVLLRSCYLNSLALAEQYGCSSVAFPLLSCGVYGYPLREGVNVAVKAISDFLKNSDMQVYLVFFGRSALHEGSRLIPGIEEYIDDHYVSLHTDPDYEQMRRSQCSQILRESTYIPAPGVAGRTENVGMFPAECEAAEDDFEEELSPGVPDASSVGDFLDSVKDESFSEMLLRKIDEKGMTDSECYHKANIDRKLFSKIRSNPNYKPSKPTVLAFCVALELELNEAEEMLMKAGFALSHSSVFDIIIEYCIINKIYNIYEINEVLFDYDQSLLGSAG